MKTFIAFCLICLLNITCKAQSDTSTVTGKKIVDKIHQLQAQKIDTIVCYYVECIGGIYPYYPDSCVAHEKNYLIWMEKDKCFIQRFDECEDHEAKLISPQFLTRIRKNFSKVKNQKLKMPQYTEMVKGKPVTYDVTIDHSCISFFDIYIGEKVLEKKIDDFDLETKYIDSKHFNKNYYRNQRSLLNRLKTIIEKDVKNIN